MKATLVVLVCYAYVLICNSQITDPVPKGFNWCNPDLCTTGTTPHIACNNTQKFSKSCVNPQFQPIDATCRQAILTAHNTYRAIVANGKAASNFPKASRMMTITYDTMLASLASLNCMTCTFAHDSCRNTNTYLLSGQNLGIQYYTGSNNNFDCVSFVNNRIKSWFNEINYLPADVITSYRSSVDPDASGYGHATTLLTDRAITVGCSICQYTTTLNGAVVNASELACNYASTNVNGFNVWKQGNTAKNCVTGQNSQYAGLCSTNENPTYNPNTITRGMNGTAMTWPQDFEDDYYYYDY